MTRVFSVTSMALLFLGMTACSQGRKSLTAGSGGDRLSEVVILKDNNGYPAYGKFQLQLNLDKNFVYLDVLQMANGWTADNSYRVFAKHAETGEWVILAEGLTAGPGQTVSISAYQGQQIWQYTEWIVAFEYQEYGLLFDWDDASSYMVEQTIYWEEYKRKNSL